MMSPVVAGVASEAQVVQRVRSLLAAGDDVVQGQLSRREALPAKLAHGTVRAKEGSSTPTLVVAVHGGSPRSAPQTWPRTLMSSPRSRGGSCRGSAMGTLPRPTWGQPGATAEQQFARRVAPRGCVGRGDNNDDRDAQPQRSAGHRPFGAMHDTPIRLNAAAGAVADSFVITPRGSSRGFAPICWHRPRSLAPRRA